MHYDKPGSGSGSMTLFILLTVISAMLLAAVVYAAPPIEEMRTIISQKALKTPPPELVAALNTENLEKGLRAIDPFARYMAPDLSSSALSSSLYLGVDIFSYKSKLWIRSDPGGPAAIAGIPEIGILLAINDKSVKNEDVGKIARLIDRAIRERLVTLTVSDALNSISKNYVVKPIPFSPPSVTWNRLDTDVVIRIRNFISHDTAPRLLALCKEIEKTGSRIIIDLRGCSGGDLYESIEIAGFFVQAGRPLANTHDRTGVIRTYRSPPGKKLSGPIWLLIDQRTASAAEILAGILQHYKFAQVAGERSFGKFVSQTIFPLSEGGELCLTTLAVHFPGHAARSQKGIEPDILYNDISVAYTADVIYELSSYLPTQN